MLETLMSRRIQILPAICTVLVFHFSCANEDNILQQRFEYKFSFKGPHLIQSDLTVPFWTLLGDTVAGDDQIRLVPSIRDKKGLAWSNYPFPYENWEVEVHVRVDGRGKIGADGFAIWYTSTSPPELGPVYGSKDYWSGLGVFLDSFDNDNKLDNPSISVVVNDGTMEYHHGNDGRDQQSGSCSFDFRNKPFPVKIRLRYFKQMLTVSYNSGNLADDDFIICTSIENLSLPANYYFGVSAATGGLADDHDALKFLTWSFSDKPAESEDEKLREEERKEMMDDYEKNLEDFNKMREEYKRQNPDAYHDRRDPEALYEGAASQELRSVFEIQSALKKEIRGLSDMVGHMLEQQNNIMAKLDSGGFQRNTETKAPAGADDNAKKYHIDNVLNIQRETYDALKGIGETMARVEQTMGSMDVQMRQNSENRASRDVGTQNSYEEAQQRQQVAERFQRLQSDVSVLMQRQPITQKVQCPEPEMPSCISLGLFVAVAAIQVVVLLLYHITRTSREDAAKKFF